MNKIPFISIALALFFVSCTTIKVELNKVNSSNVKVDTINYIFSEFHTPYRILRPEEAYNFATTESQKIAAEGLKYLMQNRYEDAAETFVI